MSDATRASSTGSEPPTRAERLRQDQRSRWQRGERVPVEAYLQLHPDLRGDAELLLDLIYQEVLLRLERGEQARLEEYEFRFPDLAAPLREHFEVHQALESGGPFDTAPAPPREGERVAPSTVPASAGGPVVLGYEIQGELGRGAIGVVYRAVQTSLRRPVALKMLREGVLAEPAQIARFRREAETVARLRHPNVVHVYEVGAQDGRPYFSMECVDGGSLAERLAGVPWPARQAAGLVETLARAAHAAHQSGVVHRDLKPANVLLAADDTPKIADFGLAKQLDGTAGSTSTGAILGTPCYMAPEQAEGRAADVGPAADVYALGAILYEAVTGRPPFKAETTLETLEQVRSLEPVPPRRLRPKLPRDVDTICLKCLQKKPDKRYASAGELADDLRRFLNGEPIRARPVGRAARLWRWGRRKPAAAALLAVSAAALACLLALGAWSNLAIRAALKESEDQKGAALRAKADAVGQRRLADGQRDRAEGLLNASTLKLAQQAWEGENVRRLRDLLDGVKPQPGAEDWRAFEWHFLDRLCNRHRLELGSFRGFPSKLALAPDGRTLALLANRGGTVWLWDAADGRQRAAYHHWPGTGINDFAYFPDGKTLATAGGDGMLRLWDVGTGKVRRLLGFEYFAPWCVAVAPDGKAVATGSGNGIIRLWNPATGDEIDALPPFDGHQGPVDFLAFLPGGKELTSWGLDGTVKIWDLAGRKVRATLDAGSPGFWAFSPDGKSLLTASGIGKLWDLPTGKQRAVLSDRSGAPVLAVAAAPDGQTFATTAGHPFRPDLPGGVTVWDALTGRELKSLTIPSGGGFALAYSAEGTLAVGGDSGTVRVWDPRKEGPDQVFFGHSGRVCGVAFSPDGRTVVSVGGDQKVRYWDPAAEPVPLPLRGHAGRANAVAFTPDGRTIVSGGGDGTVRLWDAATGKPGAVFGDHKAGVCCLAVSPDGKLVASGAENGLALVQEIATGKILAQLPGHAGPVLAVAFSPDGKRLATSCHNRPVVYLWDAATGRQEATLAGHESGAVWGLAFAPDGRTLASGGSDRTIRLWDPRAHQLRATLRGPASYAVQAVAFSRDGKTLVSANFDSTVRLWDPETGEQQALCKGHFYGAVAAAVSPDGRTIVSGAKDGTLRFWDVATHQERFALAADPDTVAGIAFSPDGQTLATAGFDGTVKLWRAGPKPASENPPKP